MEQNTGRELRSEEYGMITNVLTYLDEIVKKFPDKIAYANEAEAFTFRQVYEQSRAIGTYLHKQKFIGNRWWCL